MNAVRRRHQRIDSPPKGERASAGKTLALLTRIAGVIMLAGLATGCISRPVGDFGRAQPSVLHDNMLPAVGDFAARQRKEPVSGFNQTDQEREMHDRTWRFLVAAHSRDWTFDTSVEMQRTRIGRASDHKFMTDRYYRWLRETQYQSSRTRYATVGRHIAADFDTVPTTFASICAVIEVDRQRREAMNGLGGFDDKVRADVAARRVENLWHIDWFVRALNYRYESYFYALDHLLVETPHEQSMAVDESLRRLKPWVERANRGDFCSDDSGRGRNTITIPSRFQTMVRDTEEVVQK
jgi:hypothetical protein